MRAVLDKIAESLEGDISIEPDWLSEHVGVLPEDRVRIHPEVWAQVAGHMRAGYQTLKKRPRVASLKKKEQGRLSLLLKSHAKNNS